LKLFFRSLSKISSLSLWNCCCVLFFFIFCFVCFGMLKEGKWFLNHMIKLLMGYCCFQKSKLSFHHKHQFHDQRSYISPDLWVFCFSIDLFCVMIGPITNCITFSIFCK
jgi:hypothetical protein